MIPQVIYVSSGMHYEVLFDDKFRIRSTIGGEAQLMSQKTFILNNCMYLNIIPKSLFLPWQSLRSDDFLPAFATCLFQDHGQGPRADVGKHFS